MDWGPVLIAAIVATPATIAAIAAAQRAYANGREIKVLKHNTDGMMKTVESMAKATGKSEGITEERARSVEIQNGLTGPK